jgi:hypothetical protein
MVLQILEIKSLLVEPHKPDFGVATISRLQKVLQILPDFRAARKGRGHSLSLM